MSAGMHHPLPATWHTTPAAAMLPYAPNGPPAGMLAAPPVAAAMQPPPGAEMADAQCSNAHGTSTPAGDIQELKAVRNAYADRDHMPIVGSTKSLSGHSLGAAGVQEAIYSLLMQQHNFIAASANIETLDPEAEGVSIATARHDDVDLERVMSNSFGFGGTNASLVFAKYRD